MEMGNFCYICLDFNKSLISTTFIDEDSITIHEKIIKCVPEIIWTQNKTSVICLSCRDNLRISYNFRELSLKSNRFIQDNLFLVKQEVDNEEYVPKINDELMDTDLCTEINENRPKSEEFSTKLYELDHSYVKKEFDDSNVQVLLTQDAVPGNVCEKIQEMTHKNLDLSRLSSNNEDNSLETTHIKDEFKNAEVIENSLESLPERSRRTYEIVYRNFMEWKKKKGEANSFSENILLTYFTDLSQKYKSSSLWSNYSMLRSTLNIYHNVNIQTYSQLRQFLKSKSEGYSPNKSKIFTPKEIAKFVNEAPDDDYLVTKVILAMGVMGACRAAELHSMTIDDVKDLDSVLLVTIPETKTKGVRKFVISGQLYNICKKYMELRPVTINKAFFLKYQNGKCAVQNMGLNKLARAGKLIATYLKLKDSDRYTGFSFRRTSATLLIDGGGDISDVKKRKYFKVFQN